MPRHKADVLDTEDPARGIKLRVPCLAALDFAFMVNHVQNTLLGFLLLGIGSCLASIAAMWAYFRHKRWM